MFFEVTASAYAVGFLGDGGFDERCYCLFYVLGDLGEDLLPVHGYWLCIVVFKDVRFWCCKRAALFGPNIGVRFCEGLEGGVLCLECCEGL